MNTEWNIEFYQKLNGDIPVEEFITSLTPEHQAKAYWEIELLEKNGIMLTKPYMKSIKGEKYKGLKELRIEYSGDQSRIFYFLPKGNTFILLHGFIKKTQKTPPRELERARKHMEDYLRRCKQ